MGALGATRWGTGRQNADLILPPILDLSLPLSHVSRLSSLRLCLFSTLISPPCRYSPDLSGRPRVAHVAHTAYVRARGCQPGGRMAAGVPVRARRIRRASRRTRAQCASRRTCEYVATSTRAACEQAHARAYRNFSARDVQAGARLGRYGRRTAPPWPRRLRLACRSHRLTAGFRSAFVARLVHRSGNHYFQRTWLSTL